MNYRGKRKIKEKQKSKKGKNEEGKGRAEGATAQVRTAHQVKKLSWSKTITKKRPDINLKT